MYVYIKSKPGLWTVGHYSDRWFIEGHYKSKAKAAKRTAFLNGQGCFMESKLGQFNKLIVKYTKKVAASDKHIERINAMIEKVVAEADDADYLTDLKAERSNAERDRQLYFQFTKDLESLLDSPTETLSPWTE